MMLGPTKLPDGLQDFNEPPVPTIYRSPVWLPPVDHVPARPPVVLQIDCDAFRRRAFRRGVICGLALALVALSVVAFLVLGVM